MSGRLIVTRSMRLSTDPTHHVRSSRKLVSVYIYIYSLNISISRQGEVKRQGKQW